MDYFVDNGFGGKDEQVMQENFEELCGGYKRAERLMYLWNNSYKTGTKYDFLMGGGRSKIEVFEKKAKEDGFTKKQIECFYSL